MRATDRTVGVIDQLLQMNRIATGTAPEATPLSRIAEAVGRELAPASLDRAFDRFQRLGRTEPGSGLGLAIVRRIVDAAGGQISLRNLPQVGLVASVLLPMGQEPA